MQVAVAGDNPKAVKALTQLHNYVEPSEDPALKKTSKNQLYFIAQEHRDTQFFLNFKEFKGDANAPGAPVGSEVKWENGSEVWFRSSIGRGYISDRPTQILADQKPLVKEILKQAESFKTKWVLAQFTSVEKLTNGTHEKLECIIPLLEFKELFQAALDPVVIKPTPSGVDPKTGEEASKSIDKPKKSIITSSSLEPKELTSGEPTSFSFNTFYMKIAGGVTLAGVLALIYYFKYIAVK